MNTRDDQASIKCCMVGIFNYFVDSRVRGYAKWLTRNGNMVDVLTLYRYKTNQMVDEDGVRIFAIQSRQSKSSHLLYLLDYAYSFFVFCFLLTKLYFQNRYDVIHFHNMPDFLVFAGLIPKLFGAKIILDVHDPMPEMYISKFPSKEHSLGMRLIRAEERLSAAFADAVIAANPHFKDNLIDRGVPAKKITTINNYPDTDIFNRSAYLAEAGKSNEYYTLIFPGTIAPRYGLEVAIKAMPFLKEKISNIHLLIIGRLYEHASTLKSLAEELGVSSLVEFRAGIPNKEIPALLLQADVGIYPALPDSHMSIAVPGKLLEFAIMGLPIVTSRLRIVEEIFDDSAVLFFEPGNSDEFSHCVLKIYTDKNLRDELVRKADLMLAQKYPQEQEVQTYMTLISHLLEKRQKIPGLVEDPK